MHKPMFSHKEDGGDILGAGDKTATKPQPSEIRAPRH